MSLTLVMGGQHVTAQVSNIQPKNIKDGGYASVTFNVKRELDQALFDTFTDVLVYDPVTAEQVGGGRLLEQGRNDDGTWQVTCLGEGLASMQDTTTPYFVVDQNYDLWDLSSRSTKRMEFNTNPYPTSTTPDDPNLFLDTSDGANIVTNAELVITNRLAQKCNQHYGAIYYRLKSGITNSSWRTRTRMYSNDLTGWDSVDDAAWSTTISATQAYKAGVDWANPRQVAGFQWKRITTDAVSGEDTWSVVRDVVVRAQIYGRNGVLMDGTASGVYTSGWVRPDQVLVDWVVRYCGRLNAATGTIDTTSTEQIEQMAYLDGIHGMQLAEDVAAVEPGFIWQVWNQDSDGTWPFDYIPLPTEVQYEASADDGFSAPTPSTEIYDQVIVTGKTKAGKDINLLVTTTNPALVAAGLHRRATIPLGSEIWSTAAATRVGNDFLDEHAVAPNAGTITIARPIYDALSGRWVRPSHIRSGGLMRVRGIQPLPDSLNATSSDGVTVFRVVSATYDNDSGSTVCELDSYSLTEARAIAELSRARTRRGAA